MPSRLSPRERLTLLEHDAAGARPVRAPDLIRLHRLAAAGFLYFQPTNVRRPRRSRLTTRGHVCAQLIREARGTIDPDNSKFSKAGELVKMPNLHRVKNLGETEIEIQTECGKTLQIAPGGAIVCAPKRIRAPRIGCGAWEIEPASPAEPQN